MAIYGIMWHLSLRMSAKQLLQGRSKPSMSSAPATSVQAIYWALPWLQETKQIGCFTMFQKTRCAASWFLHLSLHCELLVQVHLSQHLSFYGKTNRIQQKKIMKFQDVAERSLAPLVIGLLTPFLYSTFVRWPG